MFLTDLFIDLNLLDMYDEIKVISLVTIQNQISVASISKH